MGYGSRTDETGAELRADGAAPILTGQNVTGNVITYFGMSKDQDGNTVDNRAEIQFRQSNGAKFTYTFFDSDQGWAQDKVNTELLHICTKLGVTKDEYYAALPGENISFTSMITAIQENIMPKAEGKTFTLKIVYKENKNNGKWYAQFPNFPNFIEEDGTNPTTFNTNPKYDFYTIPSATTDSELEASSSTENVF
jgi:hypothetical protein